MKNTLILFAALLITPLFTLSASGVLAMPAPKRAEVVLFVSTTGNDSWSGTLSEANATRSDGPLATLNKARLKVREQIAKGLTSPITVQICGGEYELDKTVVFGPEDSGTKACAITYAAYPGEKPVFTGGKKVLNWEPARKTPRGCPKLPMAGFLLLPFPRNLKANGKS